MTLEQITHAAGNLITGAGLVLAGVFGKGLFGWLSERAKAHPANIEQHTAAMAVVFAQLRIDLKRQDEQIEMLRDEGHKLRNRLFAAEGISAVVTTHRDQLRRYARMCINTLTAHGHTPPEPSDGQTIDELMTGPVALYGVVTPSGPVTDKDNR